MTTTKRGWSGLIELATRWARRLAEPGWFVLLAALLATCSNVQVSADSLGLPKGSGPEVGDLAITEVLATCKENPGKKGFYAESDANANDMWDECDRFFEVVNLSNSSVDLNGIEVTSDKPSKPHHVFRGTVLEPGQAVVVFYGYDECGKFSPQIPGTVVELSDEYTFVPDDPPQLYLRTKDDIIVDKVTYGANKSCVSMVRPSELQPWDGQADAVELVPHTDAFCTAENAAGEKLAFSPGKCLTGADFVDNCEMSSCKDQPVSDLDVVADAGGPDSVGSELTDGVGSDSGAGVAAFAGSVVITEINPFESVNANGDFLATIPVIGKCDRFIELTSTSEEAIDLIGVSLVIDNQPKHTFAESVVLGPGESLVLLSGSADCPPPAPDLPYAAIMMEKSFYQDVTGSGNEAQLVLASEAAGIIDEVTWTSWLEQDWQVVFGPDATWTALKENGYSLVRVPGDESLSVLFPQPFHPCYAGTVCEGIKCEGEWCGASPGTAPCSDGLPEECVSGPGPEGDYEVLDGDAL